MCCNWKYWNIKKDCNLQVNALIYLQIISLDAYYNFANKTNNGESVYLS